MFTIKSFLFFTFYFTIALSVNSACQTWMQASGISSTSTIYSIVEHNGKLFAAGDSVLYKSTDEGTNWLPLNSQIPPNAYFTKLFSQGNELYLGTSNYGIFRSDDDGQHWLDFNSGLGASQYAVDFAVRGDSLYAGFGSSGIYVINLKSPVSWQPFNDGLFQQGVNALTVSGTALIASVGMYVFIRPQGASAWTDIQIDSANEQQPALKFIATPNHVYAGTSIGIFSSDLTGRKWEKTGIKLLPNLPVETFAVKGARLLAGVRFKLEHFICSSDDEGKNWTVRAHEFAQLIDMAVIKDRIIAGRTDGIWYNTMSGWTNTEHSPNAVPAALTLYQNYPNPFNPTTGISYQLPVSGMVTLKVYTILGEEVSTLVDEVQSAGQHTVSFDPVGLSSGIYLYTLRSGNFTQTKKMILLQ